MRHHINFEHELPADAPRKVDGETFGRTLIGDRELADATGRTERTSTVVPPPAWAYW